MNPQKKLEKLAKMMEDKDLSNLENFLEIQEKLEEYSEHLKGLKIDLDEVKNKPEPIDHSETLDELKKSIDEPLEITVKLNIV